MSRRPYLMLLSLAWLSGLSLAGCCSYPGLQPKKPIEQVRFIQANKVGWQASGIVARRGDIVNCIAEGQWGDQHGLYGPQGNPAIYKDHLGISAPANALLMKIDFHTNQFLHAQIVPIAQATNLIARASGQILFANNVSLPLGMQGLIKVTLTTASDSDGDGVSDYDEITLWQTDPLHPDSAGSGFRDDHEIAGRKDRLKNKAAADPL